MVHISNVVLVLKIVQITLTALLREQQFIAVEVTMKIVIALVAGSTIFGVIRRVEVLEFLEAVVAEDLFAH
jgi:hypothetical protein